MTTPSPHYLLTHTLGSRERMTTYVHNPLMLQSVISSVERADELSRPPVVIIADSDGLGELRTGGFPDLRLRLSNLIASRRALVGFTDEPTVAPHSVVIIGQDKEVRRFRLGSVPNDNRPISAEDWLRPPYEPIRIAVSGTTLTGFVMPQSAQQSPITFDLAAFLASPVPQWLERRPAVLTALSRVPRRTSLLLDWENALLVAAAPNGPLRIGLPFLLDAFDAHWQAGFQREVPFARPSIGAFAVRDLVWRAARSSSTSRILQAVLDSGLSDARSSVDAATREQIRRSLYANWSDDPDLGQLVRTFDRLTASASIRTASVSSHGHPTTINEPSSKDGTTPLLFNVPTFLNSHGWRDNPTARYTARRIWAASGKDDMTAAEMEALAFAWLQSVTDNHGVANQAIIEARDFAKSRGMVSPFAMPSPDGPLVRDFVMESLKLTDKLRLNGLVTAAQMGMKPDDRVLPETFAAMSHHVSEVALSGHNYLRHRGLASLFEHFFPDQSFALAGASSTETLTVSELRRLVAQHNISSADDGRMQIELGLRAAAPEVILDRARIHQLVLENVVKRDPRTLSRLQMNNSWRHIALFERLPESHSLSRTFTIRSGETPTVAAIFMHRPVLEPAMSQESRATVAATRTLLQFAFGAFDHEPDGSTEVTPDFLARAYANSPLEPNTNETVELAAFFDSLSIATNGTVPPWHEIKRSGEQCRDRGLQRAPEHDLRQRLTAGPLSVPAPQRTDIAPQSIDSTQRVTTLPSTEQLQPEAADAPGRQPVRSEFPMPQLAMNPRRAPEQTAKHRLERPAFDLTFLALQHHQYIHRRAHLRRTHVIGPISPPVSWRHPAVTCHRSTTMDPVKCRRQETVCRLPPIRSACLLRMRTSGRATALQARRWPSVLHAPNSNAETSRTAESAKLPGTPGRRSRAPFLDGNMPCG